METAGLVTSVSSSVGRALGSISLPTLSLFGSSKKEASATEIDDKAKAKASDPYEGMDEAERKSYDLAKRRCALERWGLTDGAGFSRSAPLASSTSSSRPRACSAKRASARR